MISCDAFRTRFAADPDGVTVLAHLRACDRCLDFAVQSDPDVMFRALGGNGIGGEMIPPGGVDAFVADVMQQVRVRAAESTVTARNVVSWPRRLAVAATLVAGMTGAMLYNQATSTVPGTPVAIARGIAPVTPKKLATKPVVETYESDSATIVEMPSEGAGDDVKIVMIFDENLPADL
jgi:lysophospholipase L1-like esterase